MTITSSQLAASLTETAKAITAGLLPAEAVYVADHGVTVLTNPVSAIRWRESHGDELAGVPLHVVSVKSLDVAS